jgi:dienelactone hydrolase
MKFKISITSAIVLMMLFNACKSDDKKDDKIVPVETKTPKLKEVEVVYTIDSLRMRSFVYYDENLQGKRPAVLVVHEWWGLNDYTKRRAKMLAEMGYIAMAVDMYGNDRMGDDPKEAQALATPYYMDPQMAKKVFDSAMSQIKKYEQTDQGKMAGIGYCFGGGVLLNITRLGEPLNGIVSFHGTLPGVPANKDLTKAETLVCNGEADTFVSKEAIAKFKKEMDSIGAKYTFKDYPGALHAFTNPDATEAGKKFNLQIAYNGPADTASWNEMKLFFGKIFK